MKNIIQILFFTLILASCSQSEKHDNNYEAVELIEQNLGSDKADEFYEEETNEEEESPIYGFIEINFLDFDFTVSHPSIYESKTINGKDEDTTIFYLDLGETIDSAAIEIHHGGVYLIDIYQMHENSITIMNEGPHCDLVDWKHYYSDWKAIKRYNNYDFVAENYTREDWDKFLDIDINELEGAVKEHCGEEWAEHVKDVKTYSDYPSGISMSRIFFKVVLTNEKTGETKEHIIAMEQAMGC